MERIVKDTEKIIKDIDRLNNEIKKSKRELRRIMKEIQKETKNAKKIPNMFKFKDVVGFDEVIERNIYDSLKEAQQAIPKRFRGMSSVQFLKKCH
jgi:uncharacterized protein (UPF0335 family)